MKDIDSERGAPPCYLSKERVRSDVRRLKNQLQMPVLRTFQVDPNRNQTWGMYLHAVPARTCGFAFLLNIDFGLEVFFIYLLILAWDQVSLERLALTLTAKQKPQGHFSRPGKSL